MPRSTTRRSRTRARAEDEAERLRLYYVAMTRAKERLIVSGSIDREKKADAATPIGWVLDRLDADEELDAAGDAPVEIARNEARASSCASTATTSRRGRRLRARRPTTAKAGSSASSLADEQPPPPRRPRSSRRSPRVPDPPLHRVRRLSFTALSTFEQCSYKYYALRVAGMAERRPEHRARRRRPAGDRGRRRRPPAAGAGRPARARRARPRAGARVVPDRERRGAGADPRLRRLVLRLGARAPRRRAERHREGAALHVRARRRAPARLPRRASSRRPARARRRLQDEHRRRRVAGRDRRGGLPAAAARLRARLLPRRRRRGRGRYHFLERPDAVVATTFGREQVPELEAELSEAIARIHAGEFRPTPSDFACAGCPALDLVCAGPRLRGGDRDGAPPLAAVG